MIALALILIAQTEDTAQPALTATLAAEMPRPVASVTLAELLEAADTQNIDRRISVEQLRRSDAEVRAAWTALLPGLGVSAGWVHNQYPAVIPAGRLGPDEITITPQDQLEVAARIDLPLIDAQRWMRISIAEAAREGVSAREALTLDQVRKGVTTGWYSYAAALALKTSAERSVQAAEAQLKLQEIRSRAGATTELDLLRARAEVQRNLQTVADAVRLIALSRRNLRTLSGKDPGEAAQLPADSLRPVAPLSELEARVDDLPVVRAASQDVRVSEKVSTAAKLVLVPTIGAQFTERVSNAGGFTGEAASFNLGVNLQWRIDVPTFMSWDVQSSNVALAALALEKVKLGARDQINSDWQNVQAALIKVQATKAQVEAAARAREVANIRYQAGASTQIEVIQADRDLFGAEVQQIQAQGDLVSARVSLQISAGLPLETP